MSAGSLAILASFVILRIAPKTLPKDLREASECFVSNDIFRHVRTERGRIRLDELNLPERFPRFSLDCRSDDWSLIIRLGNNDVALVENVAHRKDSPLLRIIIPVQCIPKYQEDAGAFGLDVPLAKPAIALDGTAAADSRVADKTALFVLCAAAMFEQCCGLFQHFNCI